MGMDGAEPRREFLRPASAAIDAAALDEARLGFHRAFPRRSARRVFYLTQVFAFALLIAGFVWSARVAPGPTFNVLHFGALTLFALTILWRLIAASSLSPLLSRLAEPTHWPTYTILCPLYREANVTPDLVAALARLDYPGTE